MCTGREETDVRLSLALISRAAGIARLIENAFFRAILPGFDEALGPRKKK